MKHCHIDIELKYCDIQKFEQLKENIELGLHDKEIDNYVFDVYVKVKNIIDIFDKHIYCLMNPNV